MSAYAVFNNVLKDFVDAMLEKFPASQELAACGVFHKMSMRMDPKLAYTSFRECVIANYEKPLREHDDAFFLGHSYEEIPGKAEGMVIITALQNLWGKMEEADKACVFGYLDMVLEIHDRIAAGDV